MDLKKKRDVAFMKFDLDFKNLKKRTEEKKIIPISRSIEQVQKSWTTFHDAETEFFENLLAEGEVQESTERQEALWDLEGETHLLCEAVPH